MREREREREREGEREQWSERERGRESSHQMRCVLAMADELFRVWFPGAGVITEPSTPRV